MEIERHLDTPKEAVVHHLFGLRPIKNKGLGGWTIMGYHVVLSHEHEIETTVAVLASLRRGDKEDVLTAAMQVCYLMPDRCRLRISLPERPLERAIPHLCEVSISRPVGNPFDARAAWWSWLRADLMRQWPALELPLEVREKKPNNAIEPKRKTRGTSKATDAKALEAYELYYEGKTQSEIAEMKAVTPKTVGRWLKRARELKKQTK